MFLRFVILDGQLFVLEEERHTVELWIMFVPKSLEEKLMEKM
jgi:hypothetical protein